jgi:hypothetical protein
MSDRQLSGLVSKSVPTPMNQVLGETSKEYPVIRVNRARERLDG